MTLDGTSLSRLDNNDKSSSAENVERENQEDEASNDEARQPDLFLTDRRIEEDHPISPTGNKQTKELGLVTSTGLSSSKLFAQ